jgi:hypothetical protein
MGFPLLLAGPILRRVEPALVSVWVALRDPSSVRVLVWEGRAESGRPTPLAASPDTHTVRVGAKLHLAEVTVQLPDTAGTSFQPDSLYSYDVGRSARLWPAIRGAAGSCPPSAATGSYAACTARSPPGGPLRLGCAERSLVPGPHAAPHTRLPVLPAVATPSAR